MPSASYYREQAKLLRSLADGTKELDLAGRYRRRALEYDLLAKELPEDEADRTLATVATSLSEPRFRARHRPTRRA